MIIELMKGNPNESRLTRRSSGTRHKPAAPLSLIVEAVGKDPKQILGRDAEKNDLIGCAPINDLMLGKGQVTPENIGLTRQKDFSYRLVMYYYEPTREI